MMDIVSMNLQELESLMREMDQPAYRAIQIFEWLHKRLLIAADGAFFYDKTNNIPKSLQEELERRCKFPPVSIIDKLTAKDGTVKFLLSMGDVSVESVLMVYVNGRSLCISTQAGCRMGCYFCATGQGGFIRNLSAGEMCLQVYAAGDVRNIVLMGCGEPLDNFDATMRFIELITHPKCLGIGQRHITLSTCGLVPEILALAEKNLQINLAVSLHGPDDTTRQALMPIAKRHLIKDVIAACRKYAQITRRRITFEYALAAGVNDSPAHARALSQLLKGMLCHVNIIPVNATNDNFSPTKKSEAKAFMTILEQARIPATIRRTIGAEVDAACGQLKSRKNGTNK